MRLSFILLPALFAATFIKLSAEKSIHFSSANSTRKNFIQNSVEVFGDYFSPYFKGSLSNLILLEQSNFFEKEAPALIALVNINNGELCYLVTINATNGRTKALGKLTCSKSIAYHEGKLIQFYDQKLWSIDINSLQTIDVGEKLLVPKSKTPMEKLFEETEKNLVILPSVGELNEEKLKTNSKEHFLKIEKSKESKLIKAELLKDFKTFEDIKEFEANNTCLFVDSARKRIFFLLCKNPNHLEADSVLFGNLTTFNLEKLKEFNPKMGKFLMPPFEESNNEYYFAQTFESGGEKFQVFNVLFNTFELLPFDRKMGFLLNHYSRRLERYLTHASSNIIRKSTLRDGKTEAGNELSAEEFSGLLSAYGAKNLPLGVQQFLFMSYLSLSAQCKSLSSECHKLIITKSLCHTDFDSYWLTSEKYQFVSALVSNKSKRIYMAWSGKNSNYDLSFVQAIDWFDLEQQIKLDEKNLAADKDSVRAKKAIEDNGVLDYCFKPLLGIKINNQE